MEIKAFREGIHQIWQNPGQISKQAGDTFYIAILGALIGIAVGAVISIFRITTDWAIAGARHLANGYGHSWWSMSLWIFLALAAGLIVGRLARNPAVPFGGAGWIEHALNEGSPGGWRRVLVPKFIGSWLVMASCISVGREGPCIQMGAATALGLKPIDHKGVVERRFFILAGCAAGLAAAFSAPFAGVCYVFEIMREKFSNALFLFLMAGGVGVYLACSGVFGLDVMLPLGAVELPGLLSLWLLIPLGLFAGVVGIAYNWLLRFSVRAYRQQPLVPLVYRPLFAFFSAAIMVLIFPAITGEGLSVFSVSHGAAFLCLFLAAKLVFTAFCYGSFIPAGLMVPIICLGGVAGKIYAAALAALGFAAPEAPLIAMGMAGAFAAAERAPVTALVLIAEMTAAWAIAPGMLAVAAIGAFMARLARVRIV